MKKLGCALLLATTLLIGGPGQNGQGQNGQGQNGQGQNGQGQNGQGQNGQGQNGQGSQHVSMAEPSAIPELILLLSAIGFLAWRQRREV
jgi:hypothetical protein